LKIDPIKLLPDKIDFAFIDGQKNQYANYLININNILSTKNVLVFDDVIKFKFKMSSLYEYLEKMQIFYEEMKMEKGD
jgi:predicted O-methyltransferase YrrM